MLIVPWLPQDARGRDAAHPETGGVDRAGVATPAAIDEPALTSVLRAGIVSTTRSVGAAVRTWRATNPRVGAAGAMNRGPAGDFNQ